jgi:hypothetical protein
METKSLSEFCLELLSKEVRLQKTSGFDDIEHVKLLTGEDGGGIKIYGGERIEKVTLVDFKFGQGVPIPSQGNRIGIGSELFQIIPDFSYKIPIWGINTVIMQDGTYTFDTDFSFGFDLVMDYEFTMKYLEPFNEVYKKYCGHKDFKRVFLDETTTWVRAYISPAFIIAETTGDKRETVYELCSEFIKLWVKIYREADRKDETFKENQKKRIHSQYYGMKDTDRVAQVILKIFGQETFSRFFKAFV